MEPRPQIPPQLCILGNNNKARVETDVKSGTDLKTVQLISAASKLASLFPEMIIFVISYRIKATVYSTSRTKSLQILARVLKEVQFLRRHELMKSFQAV